MDPTLVDLFFLIISCIAASQTAFHVINLGLVAYYYQKILREHQMMRISHKEDKIYARSLRVLDYLDMLTNDMRSRKFMETFRLTRESFILFEKHLIAKYPKKRHGWWSRAEMLVFLYWLGQGVTYNVVANAFKIPKSTIADIIRKLLPRVSGLAKEVIKLPNQDELQQVARGFQSRVGTSAFSAVAGAVDGTLIAIKAPKGRVDEYIDRKFGISLNLTLVCDNRGYIIYAITGYPGSVHDSRVFVESSLFRKALYPPQPYYILADGAYRCTELPIRVLPVFRAMRGPLTSEQKKFNKCVSRMRVKVENTIGMLKTRWSALINGLKFRSIRMSARAIIAACVLHNICILDIHEYEEICMNDIRNMVIASRARAEQLRDVVNPNIPDDFIEDEATQRVDDDLDDAPHAAPNSTSGADFRMQICRQLASVNLPNWADDHNVWSAYLD